MFELRDALVFLTLGKHRFEESELIFAGTLHESSQIRRQGILQRLGQLIKAISLLKKTSQMLDLDCAHFCFAQTKKTIMMALKE